MCFFLFSHAGRHLQCVFFCGSEVLLMYYLLAGFLMFGVPLVSCVVVLYS